MWISKIGITNYRRANYDGGISVELKDGLNLLIGENNIGKTTIIEAIALCLNYGSVEKNVWLKEDDFCDSDKPISVILEFSGLSEAQEAAFLEALIINDIGSNHQLKFEFLFELRNDKIQTSIKCGETAATASYEVLRYLRCIYLPALRDVNLEFKPGFKSRIGKILRRKISDENEGKTLENIFKDANDKALLFNADKNPVKVLEGETNANIGKLSLDGDDNCVCLSFVEQEFTRILSNVTMKARERGLDINTNGLGYNNLIYISTVLTELKVEQVQAPQNFTCLLIEEPEAHLHPQLQTLLLEFLQSEYKTIQVILSSHSPTLSAAIDFNNLNILSKSASSSVESVLIKTGNLGEESKKFLQRFLDVTKSQLFFARRVMFVEGITEAILMRSLWDYLYPDPRNRFDGFGIEIVNIQGVAFSYYLDLVEAVFKKTNVKSVIITDDDRGTDSGDAEGLNFRCDGKLKETAELVAIFDKAPASPRVKKLHESISQIADASSFVKLFTARKTYEVEFGMANRANSKLIERLLGVTEGQLAKSTDVEFGIEVWRTVLSKKMKSEFAEAIVKHIDSGTPTEGEEGEISVPSYIKEAFEFLKNDYPVN